MTPVTSNISTYFVSSAQTKCLCLLSAGVGDGEAGVHSETVRNVELFVLQTGKSLC